MTPDAELARWAAGLRAESLPSEVLAGARRLLLDAIASAIAGRSTWEARELEGVARELTGAGTSTVIGGTPLSQTGAAMVNAMAITAATVCDVHRPTLTHVTPEVVPAALAAGGSETGADLLAALVAGMEVTVRVAEALDVPEHRARGWHNPGIAGPVGAAAAVGRLAGLGETGMRHAFGHAVSQAAGTFAALGTPGVKLHQSRGALSGLLAAKLAMAGFAGALDALTAKPGGLLPAYVGGGAPERLVEDLGERWSFLGIALRRWPAASSLQAMIAATLQAREEVEPGVVRDVTVDLPTRAYALNAEHGWEDQLTALQSARWMCAVVLLDGDCWVEQTATARLTDPDVRRFAAEHVDVRHDAALPLAGVRIRLECGDGRTVERRLEAPPGDPAAPLDDADVRAKLERAIAGSGLELDADAVEASIHTLADRPSADAVHQAIAVLG